MGKVGSKLKAVLGRPLKNYNVESRAFKIISKDKPTQAPTYPSLEKVMREIKSDPNLLTKGKLTPEEIKNLSQVYVTSTGDNPIIKSKQLPEDRSSHENVYGLHDDPIKIPPGKLSLRQLLTLLDKHATDPEKNSAKILAAEYKLDLQTTGHLLEYFRTFRVYVDPKAKAGTMERAKSFIGSTVFPHRESDQKNVAPASVRKS